MIAARTLQGPALVVAVVVGVLAACRPAASWPGLAGDGSAPGEAYIGPGCTVGAHNWHPDAGPCPNAKGSPPAGTGPPHQAHTWAPSYRINWTMAFVPDASDAPPYPAAGPTSPHNITSGTTWYHVVDAEVRNMRESYYERCIPVFGDPSSPMGRQNNYTCDFINVGATNTSYVVLHADRPAGSPACCIIGRPFHPPPPDFAASLPVQYNQEAPDGQSVDWNAVYDKDAGIFNYGWVAAETDVPYAFYMHGVPWVASWMWQRFGALQRTVPDPSVWELPASCDAAVACPGW